MKTLQCFPASELSHKFKDGRPPLKTNVVPILNRRGRAEPTIAVVELCRGEGELHRAESPVRFAMISIIGVSKASQQGVLNRCQILNALD